MSANIELCPKCAQPIDSCICDHQNPEIKALYERAVKQPSKSEHRKAEETLANIDRKIDGDEVTWLKYQIDCCENLLENPKIMSTYGLIPPIMQLMKFRAEVTFRLERKYGIKYGKYANGTHLGSKL